MRAKTGWGRVIITVHWLSAVAVVGLFAVGLWMVDLNYYSSWYKTAPHWHKSIGLLLAALTLGRIAWRITHARPAAFGKPWERKVSGVIQLTFYALLIGLFASGYLISTADGRGIELFNWFTVPGMGSFVADQEDVAGDIHSFIAWSLIVLSALHALAALKHHFIDRDATLKQMLRR